MNKNIIDAGSDKYKDDEDLYAIAVTYLYAAINDSQAAIRALDTKLSVVLVMLSIALTKADMLLEAYNCFFITSPKLALLGAIIFILSWLIGVWASFFGIAAIDNPTNHISNNFERGTFYAGGLLKAKFMHSFVNFSPSEKIDLLAHKKLLPRTSTEVFNELSLEQVKLAYIRGLKIRRSRTAYIAAACAVATVLGGLLISLI